MDDPNHEKKKKRKKKKPSTVISAAEMEFRDDIVFYLNVPQKPSETEEEKNHRINVAHKSQKYVPARTAFRIRRYPVCTSAYAHDHGDDDGEPKKPRGDADELFHWTTMHHRLAYIYGVHILELTRLFKPRSIPDTIMQKIVVSLGGEATLDLVFPEISRSEFSEMINDVYGGGGGTAEGDATDHAHKKAEEARKKEITAMVGSRTKGLHGRNRIVPVWFLMWALCPQYVRREFFKFNSRWSVCTQILTAMQGKANGSSIFADQELLDQSRLLNRSMEIEGGRLDMTVMECRTNDVLGMQLACRSLYQPPFRVWQTRSHRRPGGEKDRREAEEAEEEFLPATTPTTTTTKGKRSRPLSASAVSLDVRIDNLESDLDLETYILHRDASRVKAKMRQLERSMRWLLQSSVGVPSPPCSPFSYLAADDDDTDDEEDDFSSSPSSSSDDDDAGDCGESSSSDGESAFPFVPPELPIDSERKQRKKKKKKKNNKKRKRKISPRHMVMMQRMPVSETVKKTKKKKKREAKRARKD